LKIIELKVDYLETTVESIKNCSAARLAENQDCDTNKARKDRLIMSGYDCLKQEKGTNGSFIYKCDEEKINKLFQELSDALSKNIVVKCARPLKKNTPESKIEVRLESPEQATLVKNYFKKAHPMSNISICSHLTMGTQVRKSILAALSKELNNKKNYKAAFLEELDDHKPTINIRMSPEDDFKNYTFADAMSDYQNILNKKNHLLLDAYKLVQKIQGTKWEDIFVVLKYNHLK